MWSACTSCWSVLRAHPGASEVLSSVREEYVCRVCVFASCVLLTYLFSVLGQSLSLLDARSCVSGTMRVGMVVAAA